MQDHPRLADGDGERFAAHGIMGLAFASGHYLALRDMSATSIGPAYRAVWHRDPGGRWSIFTNGSAGAVPRYFGATASHRAGATHRRQWPDDHTFEVRMGRRLDWGVTLGATPSARMMSAMGRAMPARGGVAGPCSAAWVRWPSAMLRSGRIRLHGTPRTVSTFRAAPVQIWRVSGTTASSTGRISAALARWTGRPTWPTSGCRSAESSSSAPSSLHARGSIRPIAATGR